MTKLQKNLIPTNVEKVNWDDEKKFLAQLQFKNFLTYKNIINFYLKEKTRKNRK